MKKQIITFLFCFIVYIYGIPENPEFSTAGFYTIDNTGREVFSMNPIWKFHRGKIENAYESNYPDSSWETVSLPHGIEYLPLNASGCINYQGEVWYRKNFSLSSKYKGKKIILYFEGIMGKSKLWINGILIHSHYSGYLPAAVDISEYINFDKENIIAVTADNSNDPDYPPGKPQNTLDFSYFGGIYRDCWLIIHEQIYISHPLMENIPAGGGIFIRTLHASEENALIEIKIHIKNEKSMSFQGNLKLSLDNSKAEKAVLKEYPIQLKHKSSYSLTDTVKIDNPVLWEPNQPNLYKLTAYLTDKNHKNMDGFYQKVGIREIAFKGEKGFWLNGKPYKTPLIGANRHQDYAVIGNALPNSLHWRDAKKLRDAGLKIIRNAHYPQDPAFMDACDELGLFVIVNTPGWQFWNEKPIFEERVLHDIRSMIKRDRNHPSVLLWEPILNETWYPDEFALKALTAAEEEMPGSYSACDAQAIGAEHYPVLYSHPASGQKEWAAEKIFQNKTYFTREWGDNVDDWNSHNSPSRVNRNWGEIPMLIQAQHYTDPDYSITDYDSFFKTTPQHFGGCLWHSFDHQRGYHPDPFWGGIMDAFRQEKYSYYFFMSQRNPSIKLPIADSGPMVFIAHEMTPFSPKDVTVFSNCDEIRLQIYKEGEIKILKAGKEPSGLPHPPFIFPDVYDFMMDKQKSRERKQDEIFLLAQGFIDGKLMAYHKVSPSRRPEKILLWLDDENIQLTADGSDIITIIAAIADKNDRIKRLNSDVIHFSIEGEGKIIGDKSILTNPSFTGWGTVPLLIQSTLKPGKIKITASVLMQGSQKPLSGTLEFESAPPHRKAIYSESCKSIKKLNKNIKKNPDTDNLILEIQRLKKELNHYKLKEVERQQENFGE